MKSPTLIALLSATLAAVALGQTCQQGSAIVRLVSADTCSDVEPVMECVSKMQISTTPMCSLQFQPDLKVTDAGTFCEISRGLLQRGAAFGKWSMGKSDIDFQIKNLNNPAYPTVLVLNMKGRVVPDQGGRETQLDCNLFLNVTAGSALGVVSMGQDSLMSTTYTGPALAGATTEAGLSSTGMYGSSLQNGVMQQQPGTIGMGMQQQPGTIGMQNGQMAANGGNPYTAATSSAGSLFVRVNCIALLLAGLISVMLL